MSGLIFNYATHSCKAYNNVYPSVTPVIYSLSKTQSISGSNTLVYIYGLNFRLYSVVQIGTTIVSNITYVSSQEIAFYVPTNLLFGQYTIQVINENLASNTVNYNIDNNTGYWNLVSGTNILFNNSGTTTQINGNFYVNSGIINVTGSQGSSNFYLDPSGNATFSGDVTANSFIQTSDVRLKTNIKELDLSFNVDMLRPLIYTKDGKDEIGFLAHEVEEVFPMLVDGVFNGPKMQSLNYIGLIGVLVNEVKSLKEEIRELKDRL
jgi:Chaperone of endosialidase/IPT/TIG domain